MFKIVRCPSKLEPFFEDLRSFFLWEHFEYFRTLVLLVAFTWGRRNVSALYRQLDPDGRSHRTRFNNFMLLQRWDPEEVLKAKASQLVAMLEPRPGDRIRLLIDDTKKEKRGGRVKAPRIGRNQREKRKRAKGSSASQRRRPSKRMQGVGWIHDPTSGRKVRGHQYVSAVLEFKGFVIPFGVRLYAKKELCPGLGVTFKKTTEMAADLIQAFEPPAGVEVLVEFDSYYLCPVVVKACRRKGFHFISTLKSNRNLFKKGHKLKAGTYGKSLLRNRRRTRTLSEQRSGRMKRFDYVDAGWMQVGELGDLRVVFSRRRGERSVVGIATDHPKLMGGAVISEYSHRWAIEVFFKEAKQLLGLGQYQNGAYHAAVTHLHLVWFAYALLTHIAVSSEGAQGKKKKREPVATASTGERQNELRRIIWRDCAEYLKGLPSGRAVIGELGRLLLAG